MKSKACKVIELVEVLTGRSLDEAYFAYILLSRYVDYRSLKSEEDLIDGVWIKVGREIDLRDDMEDVDVKEFERIVEKFFSKGVILPGPDYGIPDPWPECVHWVEEEEERVDVDRWEKTGDYVELYQELDYLLKGKGKYLGDYRLELDRVWVEVGGATEPEEYTAKAARRLKRCIELGEEEGLYLREVK